MTHNHPPLRRARWLLLAAPALLSTNAFAQDATTAAPPPVRATLPAPAPQVQTPPPSRETGMPVENAATGAQSRTTLSPEAQAALDEAKAKVASRPARQAAIARTDVRRPAVSSTRVAPAPVAAAPAPTAPAPAPEAAPVTQSPTAAPVSTDAAPPAPVTEAASDTTAMQTTTEPNGAPLWPWLALAAVVIAGIAGFLLFRRRRDSIEHRYAPETDYAYPTGAEPVYIEPTPYVTPVAAIDEPVYVAPSVTPTASVDSDPVPSTPEDVTVSEAEPEEVAALTAAAPASDRPWLEFAMRPVRAGTNADEALVEIELTVANAGSLPAEDVRVSTFMLTDAQANDMERLMIDPPADAAVEPVTIAPGEGARIDATLAALRADLGVSESFRPIVVADARYRLPDGSEGRTSASFVLGLSDEQGGITPFDLGERRMHDDVEVRLHGTPQRV